MRKTKLCRLWRKENMYYILYMYPTEFILERRIISGDNYAFNELLADLRSFSVFRRKMWACFCDGIKFGKNYK